MKQLASILLASYILICSCERDNDTGDTGGKPSADMQKSSSIGWVGFYGYHMSISKTILGQARLTFPIVVFDSTKLSMVNLYINQGPQIWSISNPKKNGGYTVVDPITNWNTTKTQFYNFEFILRDGTKLQLDKFPVTLN